MAEDKKGFILYADIIGMVNQLPDDKAGLLFKHILSYVNDENPVSDDLIINVSFEPIKASLKRDLEKYERIKQRNSLNGSKGGRPKGAKQDEPKKPSGLSGNPKKPKKADSVSGSVRDRGSVRENKEEYKYTLEREVLNSVYSLFDSKYLKTEKQKQKWLDEIRLLIQIDKEDKQTIIDVITFARTDDFWISNFLTINSIRKKTSGVTKFDQIKAKCKPGKVKKSAFDNF